MTDLDRFRAEAREWLLANAPKSMFTLPRSEEDVCPGGKKVQFPPDVAQWLKVMGERGWTAPTWPKEYGGGGLSAAEGKALQEEMRALKLRPALAGFGLTMIGPLLLHEASEALKREHLPRIVRGEVRWCQGYSEPGAGSDLAGLQTRAVPDGDDFVVNGQKIWTSYADRADWMFLLVRTDPAAEKHAGITFLLMDMSSPGVSVRPIRLISGHSPFCETFIHDVRVPRSNVVGQVNGGWPIAKKLLGFERTMIADVFLERDEIGESDRMLDLARRYVGPADGPARRSAAARPHHADQARSGLSRSDAAAHQGFGQGGPGARAGVVDLQVLRHRAQQAPPRALSCRFSGPRRSAGKATASSRARSS